MALRESLRKRPFIATGTAIVTISIALALIYIQITGSRSSGLPTTAFYSVDDGATYFVDDANLTPPFDYNGKRAMKAEVFKCSTGNAFVAYLGRFIVHPQKATSGAASIPQTSQQAAPEYQVKLPLTGDRGWVNSISATADGVRMPHCPDGSKEMPQPVFP